MPLNTWFVRARMSETRFYPCACSCSPHAGFPNDYKTDQLEVVAWNVSRLLVPQPTRRRLPYSNFSSGIVPLFEGIANNLRHVSRAEPCEKIFQCHQCFFRPVLDIFSELSACCLHKCRPLLQTPFLGLDTGEIYVTALRCKGILDFHSNLIKWWDKLMNKRKNEWMNEKTNDRTKEWNNEWINKTNERTKGKMNE